MQLLMCVSGTPDNWKVESHLLLPDAMNALPIAHFLSLPGKHFSRGETPDRPGSGSRVERLSIEERSREQSSLERR